MDYDIVIAREYGLQVSLEIKIIHNNHLGTLPEGVTLSAFDNPLFIHQFSAFVLNLLDRYQGDIAYLWIGNEIDVYLSQHPEDITGFKQLYTESYAAIKEQFPTVLVETISTCHDAKVNGSLDVIETVGAVGDQIGFSLYPEMMPDIEALDTNKLFADIAAIAARLNKKFAAVDRAGVRWGQMAHLSSRSRLLRNSSTPTLHTGIRSNISAGSPSMIFQ